MGRIKLQQYIDETERLLDAQRLSEAATRCHFLLQRHPRYIKAYRLLGRALFEQRLMEDAVDIFERVLSVDPEDLVSHVGIGVACKEMGDISRALIHLNRAFDIDPYNVSVQMELRDLNLQANQEISNRVALTPSALVRLYMRGGLFELAFAEIRPLLNEEPERIDLRILLAESLYMVGQRLEAVDLALEIVEQLPNCLKALAILAAEWQKTGRANEVNKYFEQLRSILLPQSFDFSEIGLVELALLAEGQFSVAETMVDEFGEETTESGDDKSTVDLSTQQRSEEEPDHVPDWLEELDDSLLTETPSSFYSAEGKLGDPENLEWSEDVNGGEDLLLATSSAFIVEEHKTSDIDIKESAVVNDTDLDIIKMEASADLGDIPSEDEDPGEDMVSPDTVELSDTEMTLNGEELFEALPTTTVDRAPRDDPDWLNDLTFEDTKLNPDDGLQSWIDDEIGYQEEIDGIDQLQLPEWLDQSVGVDFLSPSGELGEDDSSTELEDDEPLWQQLSDNLSTDDDLEHKDETVASNVLNERNKRLFASDELPEWLVDSDEPLDGLPFDFQEGEAVSATKSGSTGEMSWLEELISTDGSGGLGDSSRESNSKSTNEEAVDNATEGDGTEGDGTDGDLNPSI